MVDKGMRILLVDDHEVVREGLRNLLSAHPEIEVGVVVFPNDDSARPPSLVTRVSLDTDLGVGARAGGKE